jgi:hypothetical protein
MTSPSKSKVWSHFEINKDKPKVATCKLCAPQIVEIERNNGTSNLWTHLKVHHVNEHDKLKFGTKGNEYYNKKNIQKFFHEQWVRYKLNYFLRPRESTTSISF